MNYLDLSRKGLELEQIFSSVINKIPDLCHPAAIRLENEDNYFNQTKDLKLEPFRKQEIFDRCITPTLDECRHNAVTSPTGEYINIERIGSSSDRTQSSTFCSGVSISSSSTSQSTLINDSDETMSSLHVLPRSKSRVQFTTVDNKTNDADFKRNSDKAHAKKRRDVLMARSNSKASEIEKKLSPQRLDALRKFQLKSDLNRRYSNLRINKRPPLEGFGTPLSSSSSLVSSNEQRTNYHANNLDRIFVDNSTSPDGTSAYPFANPIAACMLTSETIDNLRDIIISSLDIEWRMLTPIRPPSEYEENYFDKLIQLHRNRYRYQLEVNGLSVLESKECRRSNNDHLTGGNHIVSTSKPPFKHTRHGLMMQNPSQRLLSEQRKLAKSQDCFRRLHSNCMCLSSKLKCKFHRAPRSRTESIADRSLPTTHLIIPKLMLTADDRTSSEPITARQAAGEDDEPDNGDSGSGSATIADSAAAAADDDELAEFSYEHFSRFSRRNMKFARDELTKASTIDQQQQLADAADQLHYQQQQQQQQHHISVVDDIGPLAEKMLLV